MARYTDCWHKLCGVRPGETKRYLLDINLKKLSLSLSFQASLNCEIFIRRMRNILVAVMAIVAMAFLLPACGSNKESGELVGVLDRPRYNSISPYGMEYIKSGTFHIGQSDQDIFNSFMQRPMQVSIVGFFMDDTEITNNEYRQFVNYVRDSIAHSTLDHYKEDENGNQTIDWEYEIDWTDETLEDMYFQGDDVFAGKRE